MLHRKEQPDAKRKKKKKDPTYTLSTPYTLLAPMLHRKEQDNNEEQPDARLTMLKEILTSLWASSEENEYDACL